MPQKESSHKYKSLSIHLTEHGCIMQGYLHSVNVPGMKPPKGGKRGKISGWSKSSRRRLREFLVCHAPPKGSSQVGVDLTVPGLPLDKVEQRLLWMHFKQWIRDQGWSCVWRLEVQQRGSQHWHIVACVPDVLISGNAGLLFKFYASGPVHKAWLRALSKLPPVHYVTAKGHDYGIITRDQVPGAESYAVKVKILPEAKDKRAAMRYLFDHSTKSKQEQIAQGLGRHWGVIGRSRYRELSRECLAEDNPIYFRVLRWLQRLCTPRVKDSRAPFGRRAGRKIKRGKMGQTVWFTRPETVRRMHKYAMQLESANNQEKGIET